MAIDWSSSAGRGRQHAGRHLNLRRQVDEAHRRAAIAGVGAADQLGLVTSHGQQLGQPPHCLPVAGVGAADQRPQSGRRTSALTADGG